MGCLSSSELNNDQPITRWEKAGIVITTLNIVFMVIMDPIFVIIPLIVCILIQYKVMKLFYHYITIS